LANSERLVLRIWDFPENITEFALKLELKNNLKYIKFGEVKFLKPGKVRLVWIGLG
jgi:hypothetical protein